MDTGYNLEDLPRVMDNRDKEQGLVWFYGTSTIVGYLMPNPFSYIKTVLFSDNSI